MRKQYATGALFVVLFLSVLALSLFPTGSVEAKKPGHTPPGQAKTEAPPAVTQEPPHGKKATPTLGPAPIGDWPTVMPGPGHQDHKWAVCHVPVGAPQNAHFIWVSYNAILGKIEDYQGHEPGAHGGDWVYGPVVNGAPKRGTKCAPKAPPVLVTPTLPGQIPTLTATATQPGDGGNGGGGNGQPTATPPVGTCQIEIYGHDQPADAAVSSETDLFVRYVTRPAGMPVFGQPINLTASLPGYALHLSFDPNGSCRLVYQAGSDVPTLRVINMDGSGDKSLGWNGRQPDWGYGGFITFVGTYGDLLRIKADGTGILALGATGSYPDVSPSGQWIAFQTKDNTLGVIWSAGPADAAAKKLSGNGHFETNWPCERPTWDPSGEAIACAGNGLRYVIDADGTSLAIFDKGIDLAFDPLQTTPYGVVIEEIPGDPFKVTAWAVPNVFGLKDLSELMGVGISLGDYADNPDWWSWEQKYPAEDLFMQGFLNPKMPSPTPTPTATPKP